MPERAGARLWVSIVAAVIMLPAAVVLLLAAWAIRVQIAPPMLTDPSPVTLAAAPPFPRCNRRSNCGASAARDGD